MSLLLKWMGLITAAGAAWQATLAWLQWRQRRMATARALGQWQGSARLAAPQALRQGLGDLGRLLAQRIERWQPRRAADLNARLQRFPVLAAGAGSLVLQSALLGLVGFLVLAALDLGGYALLGLGLAGLPVLRLLDLEAGRSRKIQQALPDGMDLLTACVQAGLGLDQALDRTGRQLPPGPLRDDWLQALEQLRSGASRRQAFLDWEGRSASPDLGPVLRAILRSESRGVPLSPVLQAASEQMRRLRSLRIQEQAAKAPIKMLVPLMLFFLPAVFLILFGPIVLKLMASGF